MAKRTKGATVGAAIPVAIIEQIEKELPSDLVAQLKLPAQQEEFTLGVGDHVTEYFDPDAPVDTGAAPIGVMEAEEIVTGQYGTNVETDKQKKKRLAAESKAGAASARSQYKATPWMPSMPQRYRGGR